jgi:ankyrin repeat protein
MFAILENKQEVAQVLEDEGFSLMIANSEGQNILHMAAIYRRKEAFFQALNKKANHELPDKYGNSPLHYTCRAGELEMTQALLAGKPQKLPNQIHLYPIHMAIESSNMQVI